METTFTGVTARSVAVRATFEHRPLAQDRAGADLGDRLAVDLCRQHSVEEQVELVALLALFDELVVHLEVRGFEDMPLHAVDGEISRSSAVSTAVTNGSESSLPQGVFSPNALRYHSLKSMRPLFSTSFPSR